MRNSICIIFNEDDSLVLNIAVLLFSLSTVMVAIASFKWAGERSFESAVTMLVVACIAWAAGSVMGYLVPAVRQLLTKNALIVRWSAVGLFAVIACIWPWVSSESLDFVLISIIFLAAGVFVPSVMSLKSEEPEQMREAYAKSLMGAAVGSLVSVVILECRGVGSLYPIAAFAVLLAPSLQPDLFFATTPGRKRWIASGVAVLAAVAAVFAPQSPATVAEGSAPAATVFVASENVFQFRPDRKFDVYVLGVGAANLISNLKSTTVESSIKSLTATEQQPAVKSIAIPGVEATIKSGNGRRKLSAESRRFDLIQVLEPIEGIDRSEPRFAARAESALTVEALRLYFDRLKDDGFLQILGRQTGTSAQSTLSTIAEAWKKSARKDVDLHAVAVTSDEGKTLETVIVRMAAFSREERERLSDQLQIGKPGGMTTVLVSDASGAVLTDNRPFGEAVIESSDLSRIVMWIAILALLGLIYWVARQERRKGIASRWQTASVATYFGGLGMSFAFFHVFFVLRAIRGWGMPTIATGLVLAVVFGSMAAGALLLAGHPRRRHGVRIQPLANFVFAVMFTYIGAALFEPLTASGSEWISAFVGMSVLIPFGLLGGAFLPNALEEASEKLAPRVLSLLWAIYAAGTALGIYLALLVSLDNGLDVVFLAGLFCFAWVAIFSGLVRPWSVRKSTAADAETN